MEQLHTQHILRCEHCNKPFDKESTLKRHRYYCRSTKASQSIGRARSCVPCAKSKARCDNQQPECSRCSGKAIKCYYPSNVLKNKRLRGQHSDTAISPQHTVTHSSIDSPADIEIYQNVDKDADHVLDITPDIFDSGFTHFEADYFGGQDIDFTQHIEPQMNDQSSRAQSLGSSSLWFSQLSAYSAAASIPKMPTYAVRSFDQRPKLQASTHRITKLVLHTLKSYPLMMLRDNILPPFIHPQTVSSDVHNSDIESLNNCINLMHMISNGTSGSQKLFWRNVRMECDRLQATHLESKGWEMLAAMQALYVYILVRLGEGETEHNNLDLVLIGTVKMLSIRFNSAYLEMTRHMKITTSDHELEKSWKTWIFEESLRRICVMYQVMNMLIYFEPANMCDLKQQNLLLAPLPAKKQLWEATDGSKWKFGMENQSETVFGLAVNGDLVRVNRRRLPYAHCPSTTVQGESELSVYGHEYGHENEEADWEEWCSGMDGLGPLVMLAASLAA